MTDDIMQAYLEIEQAMERYTLLLDEQVKALQESPDGNQEKAMRMKAGYKAMLDSSQIYLSYAKFVAYGMPEGDDLEEDDLQA
ncbi:MAG: hypothetical protein AB7P17_08770 [Nitrospirales bacterium]|nr:hypothetical protein [Nitrospirales bacterium]